MMQDTKGDFAGALRHYERSLSLLPATAANEKIELQCQLAMAYKRTRQLAKVQKIGAEIVSSATKLKGTGNLSGDAIISLRTLVEELDSGNYAESVTPAGGQRWEAYIDLTDQICSNLLPQLDTADNAATHARCFVLMGKQQKAIKYINDFLRRRPNDSGALDLKLKIAALKDTMKMPSQLKSIRALVLAKYGPVRTANLVARAQLWALDIKSVELTISEALNGGVKNLSKSDRLSLLQTLSDCCAGTSSFALGERTARQLLALTPEDSDQHIEAKKMLVYCLEGMHKKKEADKLRTEIPNAQLDFLSDREKAELRQMQKGPAPK